MFAIQFHPEKSQAAGCDCWPTSSTGTAPIPRSRTQTSALRSDADHDGSPAFSTIRLTVCNPRRLWGMISGLGRSCGLRAS